MGTELRRMTFAVTPDMEKPLEDMKRELFFDRTRSDMIRELVIAGICAVKAQKTTKTGECQKVS